MKQNLNRYREVKSGNEGNLAKRGETGCKRINQLFKDKRRIKMRKLFVVLMAMGLCLGFTGMAMAGDNDTQTLGYEVSAINELAASGNPAAMNVTAATAGSEPDAVTDTSTSYAITTNCATDGKKITAVLDTVMPTGTTLKITLAAPSGGTSSGEITLTASAQDVVTAIDGVASSGHQISYELDATVAAGVVSLSKSSIFFSNFFTRRSL